MQFDNVQITLSEVDEDYKAFVEKFKPKKTTDDCYTPPNVYDAVLNWVIAEYEIDKDNIVRPFFPGGDYERHDYPDGCTVVDNPPFSIISAICKRYQDSGVKFFLFAPYLTNFSSQGKGITHVITDVEIQYENGATVNTSFLTNLQPGVEIRTAPKLRAAIYEADKKNRIKNKRELPKYSYPPEVVTVSMIGYLSKYGQDFQIHTDDCFFIRQLDSQKRSGKTIFGSGYLIAEKVAAEKAAAEKAAAEKWILSERELSIIASLGRDKT